MSTVPHHGAESLTIAGHHRLQPSQRLSRVVHREAGPRVVKVPTQSPRAARLSKSVLQGAVKRDAEDEAHDTTGAPMALPLQSIVVSGARNDPFSARNVDDDLPPKLVSSLLDQAQGEMTLLIPQGAKSNALPQTIVRLATGNKALLYSLLMASLAHTRARAGIPDRSALEELCTTRAVQALNLQISSPREAVTLANIWTVIGLVSFNGKVQEVRPGRLPRQSPAKEWQPLNIHGSHSGSLRYYHGFTKMVMMAGGLEALEEGGVGASLAYATLCLSTVNLQRHRISFMAHSREYLDSQGRLMLLEDERMHKELTSARLGSCFREVWPDDPGRPIIDLLDVVAHMSDLVSILDSYLDGRTSGRSPSTLMDQTNFTHHLLMSLPPAKEFAKATGTLSDELYEPGRLGCIIFSLLVVFPVPLTMPLSSKLIAALLRCRVGAKDATLRDARSSSLIAWVLTMGAIFAIGLPERRAFLAPLTELLGNLKINNLPEFRLLLGGFLWHPRTNDIDGFGVWREVQLLRQRNANKDDDTVRTAERTALPD